MHAHITRIDGDLVELDNGEKYRATQGDASRLSSWSIGAKVKIGHDHLLHVKKEKKVHVRRV